ncbi:hypothetical protein AJ80_02988 [Polytolypa hystricis UAMH7299]|uniref:Uncharacterized protein n=1 Tax=Polytolypa hystricis (strain UAMH7299) TaxID=1447883 RepID=A0A2B7YPG6_POLH7|nr:hypothetical protein AJ80_02988 [Polytolypa hystricis UAMH7299]
MCHAITYYHPRCGHEAVSLPTWKPKNDMILCRTSVNTGIICESPKEVEVPMYGKCEICKALKKAGRVKGADEAVNNGAGGDGGEVVDETF